MKLALAPIQGMTIAHYRNLYADIFGSIDKYYAPFIATTNTIKASTSLFRDILPESNSSTINIVPQLLSNNGSDFRSFASTIVNMGYKEINWNIGCPYPMVTKKKKGSGILPYPDMIKEFLDEVCLDKSYNLTVKMRLGLNNLDEGIKAIELLNDYPLKGVIIHGRTGIQKYEGSVDLDSFEVLYLNCKHEITYNGDIFSYADFKNISERFPTINNFMLGRGALRDPFLASTIKGISIPTVEKIVKLRDFHDGIYKHYKNILSGDKHLCDKMKEFWMYMSFHIDPSGKFIKKVKKCRTNKAYLDITNQIFDSMLKELYLTR
jgi:tRNA-dihydrouridine synthase